MEKMAARFYRAVIREDNAYIFARRGCEVAGV
jgi:hypothetical protein